MALSGALLWWEDWQLRVLVLSSQAAHWLLFFAVWVRTVHILRRFKPVIWIAYIGTDALAIYALATLFNRHKLATPDGETASTSLEILWAPVLLIHLGGQPPITAYVLEDNELWRRHVITLVSQVTVALYVFSKWWSGGERMLVAAVLLFILGVVEFSLKPWALWRASFSSMQASTNVSLPAAAMEVKAGPVCWMMCTSSFVDLLTAIPKHFVVEEELNLSLEEYVREAKKCAEKHTTTEGLTQFVCNYKMFVDTLSPYSERLNVLKWFIGFDKAQTHTVIGDHLNYIFGLLYTRMASDLTLPACCLSLLLPFLAVASLTLFAKSNKDGYDRSDVTVSYILLGCTVAQELLPCVVTIFLNRALSKLTSCQDTVCQSSFMSFCVRRKKPTLVMKLAAFNGIREYINKQWYWQVPAALQITGLVSQHVKSGWKKCIHDVASYKRFNNLRGERALGRHPQLHWSLERPFDQSVFLWHMATDLCFHNHHGIGQEERISGSRVISNYMMYLLSIHPHMLMLGTRPGILDLAIYELDIILKCSNASLHNEEALAREVMDTVKSTAAVPTHEVVHTVEEVEQPVTLRERTYTITHIPEACRLAEELMKLREEARWKVIQGVWVEMLCYSASRCRGYLHAKSLGEGREYLTTVWLLWAYLGMETLASMVQSQEPPEKQDINDDDDDDDDDDEEEEAEEKKKEGTSTSIFKGQADQPVEMCPV